MSKKNKSGGSQAWDVQTSTPMQDLLAFKAELDRRAKLPQVFESATPVSLDQMRAKAKAFRDSIDKPTG